MKIIRYVISAILICILLMCMSVTAANPQVYDEIIVTQPSEIVEVEEEASVKLTPNPILQYFIPITYKELDSKIAINEEVEFLLNYKSTLQQIKGKYVHYDYVFDEEISCIDKLIEIYGEEYKYVEYTIISVPKEYTGRRDFKSYEDYRQIKSKNSPHYKLQNTYAYTGDFGIRMVDERFCIALGGYFTDIIGQYIDVVLENGVVIPCILGDQKARAHTDDMNISHLTDGSILEFIVDKPMLNDIPRKMGNISYCCDEWRSPVAYVIVYNTNFFTE